MKRFISAALCVSLAFSLVACSSDSGRRNRRDRDRDDDDRDREEQVESVETTEEESSDPDFVPDFTFSTTGRDGASYDESIFEGNELTMINFFEPWCGPCVGEMGDLERLYEDYSGSGFTVIGVYSDTSMESDLDDILSQNGVTYPILHYTGEFDQFQTGYVPTTVFVDGDGHIVFDASADIGNAYVGSRDYSGWSQIIDRLMN